MKHAVCEAVAADVTPPMSRSPGRWPESGHELMIATASSQEEAASRGQMGVLLTAVAAPSSPSCSGGGNIG